MHNNYAKVQVRIIIRAMYRTLARQIIEHNIYLTLATTDGKKAWAAPVYYCYGNDDNFYFSSQSHSQHIQHLQYSRRVAFAIFDSHAIVGQGNGIQGVGQVTLLMGRQLNKAIHHYHTSFFPSTPDSFTRGPYQLYRLKPTKLFVLDPQEKHIDKRVLVT